MEQVIDETPTPHVCTCSVCGTEFIQGAETPDTLCSAHEELL